MAEAHSSGRPCSVMEEPGAAHVARVYSEAFLNAAGPEGISGALEEFRSFITDVCGSAPDLERLLASPSLSPEELIGIIDRAIAPYATPLFANFLRVLARHRRLGLLRMILELAEREAERRAGKRRVQVRSAAPLTREATQELIAKLAATIAAEPILESTVDPSLLGGLIVRIGDTVYDGSLRTRLRQLNGRLRERCLHEIQRGRDRFCHSEGN